MAAGAGPLALGGDGGGSIRIPSAFCGIVGYKPTFGVVPHEPSTPGWKTLVSLGPMARSVADARLMVEAMAGRHPLDRHSLSVDLDAPRFAPGSLRVAVSEDLGFAPLDDDVRQEFRVAVAALEGAGVEIVHDDPGLPHSSVQTWGTIATAEARRSEAYEFEHERVQLSKGAVEFLLFGDAVSIERYIQAQFVREEIFRAYADLFARTGAVALLTPTLGCEAFRHGTRHPETIGDVPIEMPWIDWASFLYDANLAGLPACALPIGLGDEGLPVSIQILGPRGSDGAVLAAADTIEAVVGWNRRPPEPPLEAVGAASGEKEH